MNATVFKKVDYTLESLISAISLGEIGLPSIQRPFVWKNAKVRDLFDSMYKGYPVGYLLFWENSLPDDSKPIGVEQKQKAPNLVIVDGQQRLTSLYAVMKDIPVVRKNYETEQIQIAFNPLEERFEVADAAIQKDKTFIPSISVLWNGNTDLFEVLDRYLEELSAVREITEEERKKAKSSIARLDKLTTFPFTVLSLASHIDEEAVADVFVRVNSKGTPLNQADFILTLMSVFWDEGRAELERFCRESKVPSKRTPSPYNHFIEPSPDQLLKVNVAIAFKRARLSLIYSILRGKDLETEQFSEDRREKQFSILKEAQDRTLNLLYWHDFMNCVRMAGYRSDRMIGSKVNLMFAYALYLIGRTEYQVPEFKLRQTIARWFFMAAITSRFSSSPESAMESDLARLRTVKTPDEFINTLTQICDVTLTNDFWNVTLPNDLATSGANNPANFAYYAALVLLDAPVLFSNNKVSDLLDPSINPKKSLVERHHLFPKAYLKKQGLEGIRDTNQIANYALVEWGDNVGISAEAPSDYVPLMRERFSDVDLDKMYRFHALPQNWEHMRYNDFLEKRRELMARVIREGYLTFNSYQTAKETPTTQFDPLVVIENGESDSVEFKSTLRINLHTGERDSRMEHAVLKTIAGFLNTSGGRLLIGVSDNGNPVGISADQFKNEDQMSLHLVNIIKERMGVLAMTNSHIHFDDYKGVRIVVVTCRKSSTPVFLKEDNVERFYIRTGPATNELSASEVQEYIKYRFES